MVQFSSLFDLRADVEKQNILSIVKSAKNKIAKLFKLNGRASSPLSSSHTIRHVQPNVVTAYQSIPVRHTSVEAISSLITRGGNTDDEHFEDLTSTVYSLVEASSPSPPAQPFGKPEFRLDRLSSVSFLSRLHAIEEEEGNAEVVVGAVNTEQQEPATSGLYISLSNSDSRIIVYLSSDTLSDYSTAQEVSLVNLETNASLVDTSLATSVDAADNHQLSPGMPRALHRVPNHDDLRVSGFEPSILHPP